MMQPSVYRPASTRSIRVEVVTDPAALRQYEEQAHALATCAIEPNIFLESWFVELAWRELMPDNTSVLLIWADVAPNEGGRVLIGLVPVQIRRLKVTRLKLANIWVFSTPYLGAPLIHNRFAVPAVRAMVDWLQANAALIRLGDWPAEGHLYRLVIDELYLRKLPFYVSELLTRATFVPDRSFTVQDYLKRSVGSERRRKYSVRWRRLEERGKVAIEELGPDGDLEQWMNNLIELEARGWKGAEGVAISATPRSRRMFENICRAAHARGQLQMIALTLDGQPLAMVCNLHAPNAVFFFKITYDESWSAYSPGILLMIEIMNRLHASSDTKWIDSCASPTRQYLNQLWTERRALQTITIATTPLAAFVLAWLPLKACIGRWLKEMRKKKPQSTPESSMESAPQQASAT